MTSVKQTELKKQLKSLSHEDIWRAIHSKMTSCNIDDQTMSFLQDVYRLATRSDIEEITKGCVHYNLSLINVLAIFNLIETLNPHPDQYDLLSAGFVTVCPENPKKGKLSDAIELLIDLDMVETNDDGGKKRFVATKFGKEVLGMVVWAPNIMSVQRSLYLKIKEHRRIMAVRANDEKLKAEQLAERIARVSDDKWFYEYPDGSIASMSEKEIIKTYWADFKKDMLLKYTKEYVQKKVTEQDCIAAWAELFKASKQAGRLKQ